jgi:hypothetical protein
MILRAKKLFWISILGATFATGLAAPANGVPLPPATTVGANLIAGGTTITATFLFANAADDSDLTVSVAAGAPSFLFSNSNAVTANASLIGSSVSFAANIGDLLTFTLNDLTVVGSYSTGIASTNVAYIVPPGSTNVATIEAALGVDLSLTAETALANLALLGPVVLVAFEDRPLVASDQDFNDLIFAFAPILVQQVPQPMTLWLLVAGGLIGSGWTMWQRRKSV